MTDKPVRYALDNSSKFYPIVRTKHSESLFRISAVLDKDVNPSALKIAANAAIKRFPTMRVRVKAGFIWHYLEENRQELPVGEFDGSVLRPIDRKANNGFGIRLAYHKNLVVIDVFHALTDGRGALEFAKVMLCLYAETQGYAPSKQYVLNIEDKPTEEEKEDSFYRYYKPTKLKDIDLKALLGKKPMLIGGVPEKHYSIDAVTIKVDDIKAHAKALSASLTAYIGGLLIYSIVRTRPETQKKAPVAMMIPVDLRSAFPSATLRNFVTFVRIVVHPQDRFTLKDYVLETAKQLKSKTTKDELQKTMATTVRSEKSAVLKYSPLFIKTAVFKFFKLFLKSRQTIIFSNIGLAGIDKSCGVENIVFNLNVSKNATVNLAAVSTNGRIALSFTRSVKDTTVQNKFFNTLQKEGIDYEPLTLAWNA